MMMIMMMEEVVLVYEMSRECQSHGNEHEEGGGQGLLERAGDAIDTLRCHLVHHLNGQ